MPRYPYLAPLCLVLLLALAVRVAWLDCQSYSMDEVNEITLAHLSIPAIIHAGDSMPPLYPLVLKGWLTLWNTDLVARSLSVIFGVASVLTIWGIGGGSAAKWSMSRQG